MKPDYLALTPALSHRMGEGEPFPSPIRWERVRVRVHPAPADSAAARRPRGGEHASGASGASSPQTPPSPELEPDASSKSVLLQFLWPQDKPPVGGRETAGQGNRVGNHPTRPPPVLRYSRSQGSKAPWDAHGGTCSLPNGASATVSIAASRPRWNLFEAGGLGSGPTWPEPVGEAKKLGKKKQENALTPALSHRMGEGESPAPFREGARGRGFFRPTFSRRD